MKKLKRILPLLFVVALASCKGGEDSSNSSSVPGSSVSEPNEPSTSTSAKPKPIALTQARINSYSTVKSVSVIDGQSTFTYKGETETTKSLFKTETAYKDDVRAVSQYEETEYTDNKKPSAPSDTLVSKGQFKKADDSTIVVQYLGLNNKLSSQSTSYNWDDRGFGNPFAARKATYFQRNADKSTDTEKVYDRKRKDVSSADEQLLNQIVTFFGGRMISPETEYFTRNGGLTSFSLTISSSAILSYSATINYSYSASGLTLALDYEITGTLVKDEAGVSAQFFTPKTGSEDATFKAARNKLATGNYTETNTRAQYASSTATTATPVYQTKVERAGDGVRGTVSKYSGTTLTEVGSALFKKENSGKYTPITKFGDKGYYVDGASSSLFPDYDISSLLFTKNGNSYTFDTSAGVEFASYDYSFGSVLDGFYQSTFTSLVVTIADDSITFKADGTYSTTNGQALVCYTTVFSLRGTTPDVFTGIMVKENGSDLVRSDIFSGQDDYDDFVTRLGGKDFFDAIPTLGGIYNSGNRQYTAASGNTAASGLLYWDVGINDRMSNSTTTTEELQTYINSLYSSYKARLEEAGFTVTDTDEASYGTKDIEKDGKTYTLLVNYGLLSGTDSSGNKSYYFGVIPSVSEKTTTGSDTGKTSSAGKNLLLSSAF